MRMECQRERYECRNTAATLKRGGPKADSLKTATKPAADSALILILVCQFTECVLA
jgi:hypothetical protein